MNAHGVVVAFDIYPFSGTSSQTIFSFQNNVNLAVSFTVEITSTFLVDVLRYNVAWQSVVKSANTLINSKQIIFLW